MILLITNLPSPLPLQVSLENPESNRLLLMRGPSIIGIFGTYASAFEFLMGAPPPDTSMRLVDVTQRTDSLAPSRHPQRLLYSLTIQEPYSPCSPALNPNKTNPSRTLKALEARNPRLPTKTENP